MTGNILVRDLMTGKVTTLVPAASASDAVRMMSEQKIGSIVIEGPDQPVGIVTERDILSKVLAFGLKTRSVAVGDIMTRSLIKLPPDRGLREACKAMIAQKGRLLVFENEHMVGIATASDLTRGIARSGNLSLNLQKIMTRRVFMAEERYSVGEAARIMNDRRIGSVLITKGGKPYGIFTERDLLVRVLVKDEPLTVELSKVASKPIVSTTADASLAEAAGLMAEHNIKRLPIYEGETPVGIVTARDIVEAYAVYA